MTTNRLARAFRPGMLALGLALASPISPPVHGDDGPKPAEGTPAGELHGGGKGRPFRDRASGKLVSIRVRATDERFFSLQCTWSGADRPVPGDVHGGEGGRESVITLAEGEYLVGVSGMTQGPDDNDRWVSSLTFKTNTRTLGPYGDVRPGATFAIEPPRGQEICGFRGRTDHGIDAIGILTRPIPTP